MRSQEDLRCIGELQNRPTAKGNLQWNGHKRGRRNSLDHADSDRLETFGGTGFDVPRRFAPTHESLVVDAGQSAEGRPAEP